MQEELRCAVCGDPAALFHPHHSDQEIADHIRAELVKRGYPDPWRKKEPTAATADRAG